MIYNPYKKNIPEIKTIKVTQEAFEKMNFYSKKVSEIIGADYECLGYLLKDSKKKDQIVRDVILDQNQKVTVGEAEGRGFYDTKKPEGMDVMGVWHSHGYNLASHSGQDIKFLETMYQNGLYNNKISLGERKKDIECIVEGEITHIFEKYSNKEIRIKGKVNQLEYVEREDAYILNSILINRNSYLGDHKNPKLKKDYDAWVWAGHNKKKVDKKFENIKLEIIDEKNDINLDKESLIKEIGDKIKKEGVYLKNLPKFQEVLNKYKKTKNVPPPIPKTAEEGVVEEVIYPHHKTMEQNKAKKVVTQSPKPLKYNSQSDLSDLVEENQDQDEEDKRLDKIYRNNIEKILKDANERDKKKFQLERSLSRRCTINLREGSGNGYRKHMEEFYLTPRNNNDSTKIFIDQIGAVLAGAYNEDSQKYWLWDDRIVKAEEIYKSIKKDMTQEDKVLLGDLLGILNTNPYAKRKHGKKLQKMCKKMGFKEKIRTRKKKGKLSKFFRRGKKK